MNCGYFKTHHCRSCDKLDLSYEQTILDKEARLKSLFENQGVVIPKLKTTQTVKTAEQTRTKAKFAVFRDSKKEIRFGFTSSDTISKELERCPLHKKAINEILPEIKQKLIEQKIEPYNIETKTGELKFLIISKSNSSSELLLRFVLRSKTNLEQIKKIAKELSENVVTANIQPIHQAVFEGEEEIALSEKTQIENRFDEFKLHLGPRSFFQVTPEIAEKLYRAAGQLLEKEKPESLLDLYCGVGAFSLYASKHCKKVMGIEISKEAIDCANSSKKSNQISNIEFQSLDVDAYLSKNRTSYDAILVNPPRRGLGDVIVKNISEIKPELILYSSCNAETMVRDFVLLQKNYRIESLQIFDMFPFTSHFETLMLLKRIHT